MNYISISVLKFALPTPEHLLDIRNYTIYIFNAEMYFPLKVNVKINKTLS